MASTFPKEILSSEAGKQNDEVLLGSKDINHIFLGSTQGLGQSAPVATSVLEDIGALPFQTPETCGSKMKLSPHNNCLSLWLKWKFGIWRMLCSNQLCTGYSLSCFRTRTPPIVGFSENSQTLLSVDALWDT